MSAAQFVVAAFVVAALIMALLAERDFTAWLDSLNDKEDDDVR